MSAFNKDGLNVTQLRLLDKLERELGKHIIDSLNNDDVIEIMLNPDGCLWIEKFGVGMECLCEFSPENAKSFMGTVANCLDTVINGETPILEGELPYNGSRFEGLLPPVVTKPTFTIRKKAIKVFTLENYVEHNIVTERQKKIIEKAIIERKNILICGGTGSGKTTLTNAIIERISVLTPEDRIIVIEDTAEIQCNAKNKVILRTTDMITMSRLLKATMRLRPDRILIGEVRGAEALDLLKSWNTGHPGGLATIHANSAKAGLVRLEQLISEATQSPMNKLIAEAINLVVFIAKTKTGRLVQEIISVKDFDIKNNNYIVEVII
ncbi:MAG: P-type conjugative transfer ATPase TrbB [Endomicrobium sp.]|nr:P-type conjugative transfer ATPase TrbB [Endomicrobium sp.]